MIIIVISKKGKITQYTESDLTFHPQIIKTKKINKQKDLSIIRAKLNYNRKLTIEECSLLIALPLFELEDSEAEIVEEVCNYIKYKNHCIPEEIINKIAIAMYLNIIKYIDTDKQEELMEKIGMAEKYEGLISQIKNKAKNEGKKEIFNELLEVFSIDAISELIHKDKSEIEKILRIK